MTYFNEDEAGIEENKDGEGEENKDTNGDGEKAGDEENKE